MKQTLRKLKEETESNTILLGDFNTSLSIAEEKLENSQISGN